MVVSIEKRSAKRVQKNVIGAAIERFNQKMLVNVKKFDGHIQEERATTLMSYYRTSISLFSTWRT